jgi:hypothetical protein
VLRLAAVFTQGKGLSMRGRLAAAAAVVIALGLGACGGGDGGGDATVGACIDSGNAVVDCDSSDAAKELVSDQSAPDAMACITIGDKPQTQVSVDGKDFCAEDK